MSDLTGPEPKTEREYLISIYASVRGMNTKLNELCDCIDDHEERISVIEAKEEQAQGQATITKPAIQGLMTIALAAVTAWITGFLRN